MSHFEERMEADLEYIRDRVWSLGEAVEDALRKAKKILVLRDEELAYSVVLGDHPINRDSRECDHLCHIFIARHLPGAGHLREMASTTRVNVSLERIGDYAVTIAREALQLSGPLPEQFSLDMDAIADESLHVLNQSRKAFRDQNAELAIALTQMARRVQSRMDVIYEALVAEDDALDGWTMLVIFVMFGLFKRVADQAKNICDQTVFTVSGVAKIPSSHKVLFLDQPDSGMGQLATAIGRKNYSGIAEFQCATPGRSDSLSTELGEFLAERGLPAEELETELIETLEHDFAEFNVIVCLNGAYGDYIAKIPFHSSALNWVVEGMDAGPDRITQYRSLRTQITDLMTLLAGEDAA